MSGANDLGRSLAPLEEDRTLVVVIEMSLTEWMVSGKLPGIQRHPLKELAVDEEALLSLLHRWREECEKRGHL